MSDTEKEEKEESLLTEDKELTTCPCCKGKGKISKQDIQKAINDMIVEHWGFW